MWALAEWGHVVYAPVRALIQRELDFKGGDVALDKLTASLTTQFAVSPKSVLRYATSHPYEVRGGVVRIAAHVATPRKSPYGTRRLFSGPEGWRYRVDVNGELVRGSGFPLPVGVATVLGCGRGAEVTLPSRLGPQRVTWRGTQPTTGSIRRFLVDLGVPEGASVLLRVGEEQFDVMPLRCADPRDPVDQAMALAGLPKVGSAGESWRLLATATGLTEGVPHDAVIAAYRDRGDADIVDLLRSGRPATC